MGWAFTKQTLSLYSTRLILQFTLGHNWVSKSTTPVNSEAKQMQIVYGYITLSDLERQHHIERQAIRFCDRMHSVTASGHRHVCDQKRSVAEEPLLSLPYKNHSARSVDINPVIICSRMTRRSICGTVYHGDHVGTQVPMTSTVGVLRSIQNQTLTRPICFCSDVRPILRRSRYIGSGVMQASSSIIKATEYRRRSLPQSDAGRSAVDA